MALLRIVLVIPPYPLPLPFDFHCGNIGARYRSELASGCFLFQLVPARSFRGIRGRPREEGRSPGDIKTSTVAEQRGFITGKPVSYANIDLQTLHYR